MLKYNEKGQLEVICTELNGVRITKDSTKTYFVEGKSNLDFDLVIIGYAADADTAIKALNLQVGDIIEIAAANDVYDVLDGKTAAKPDHEVNVNAYITRKAAE